MASLAAVALGLVTASSCYNVWLNSTGVNDTTSMPIGNGNLAANVWVADAHTVSLYFTTTEFLTHQMWLQKAGRVDVRFDPAVVSCSPPSWFLDVVTGTVHVSCSGLELLAGVSHTDDTLYVTGDLAAPSTVAVNATLWRSNRTVAADSREQGAARGDCPNIPMAEVPDTVMAPHPGTPRLLWYNRNAASSWRNSLDAEGLSGWVNSTSPHAVDPLMNLTSGGMVWADASFHQVNATALNSSQAVAANFTVAVRALAAQTARLDDWVTRMTSIPAPVAAAVAGRDGLLTELLTGAAWWADRWNRSYIVVSPRNATAAALDPCGGGGGGEGALAALAAAARAQADALAGRRGERRAGGGSGDVDAPAACLTVLCLRTALGVVAPAALNIPPIAAGTGGVPAYRGRVSMPYQVREA